MSENKKPPFDAEFLKLMQPHGIDIGPFIAEARRYKTLEESSKHETSGFFEYIPADDGWGDSFRVVDDDGMPFALEGLRRFDGRAVRITIEWDEETEKRADGDQGENAPYVYKMIGQTALAYTAERKRRQAAYQALIQKRSDSSQQEQR